MLRIIPTAALATFAAPTQAAVIYSYEGQSFETSSTTGGYQGDALDTSDRITGHIRFDEALAPNSTYRTVSTFPERDGVLPDFSFSSGTLTVTDDDIDQYFILIDLMTNDAAEIEEWELVFERRSIDTSGTLFATVLKSTRTTGFLGSTSDEASAFYCPGLETSTALTCADSGSGSIFQTRALNGASPGTWTAREVEDEVDGAEVPLPAGIALLATALGLFAGVRRRA